MNIVQGVLFDERDTLQEAKDKLEAAIEAGKKHEICPCCNRLARPYKPLIHTTMAKWLLTLYIAHRKAGNWLRYFKYDDITVLCNFKTGFGDYAKLRYWGLIEEMPKDPEDTSKPASGRWRITSDGKKFCEQTSQVPKYTKTWYNKALGHSGKYVTIIDCLGKNFNYTEYMNR